MTILQRVLATIGVLALLWIVVLPLVGVAMIQLKPSGEAGLLWMVTVGIGMKWAIITATVYAFGHLCYSVGKDKRNNGAHQKA